jgi:arylsulfatase
MGGVDGGFAFFVQDEKLHYTYNYVASEYFRVSSAGAIPSGKVALRFEFEPTGPPDIANGKGTPGRAQLYVGRKLVGETEFPYTIPLALGLAAGVCIGRDETSPVCDDYPAPFEFTGTIHRVTIDVSGDHIVDTEAEMKAIMARQ